jgi:hypothetical protein
MTWGECLLELGADGRLGGEGFQGVVQFVAVSDELGGALPYL